MKIKVDDVYEGPVTVGPETSRRIAQLMEEHDIRRLPVAGRALVGIVTRTDLRGGARQLPACPLGAQLPAGQDQGRGTDDPGRGDTTPDTDLRGGQDYGRAQNRHPRGGRGQVIGIITESDVPRW